MKYKSRRINHKRINSKRKNSRRTNSRRKTPRRSNSSRIKSHHKKRGGANLHTKKLKENRLPNNLSKILDLTNKTNILGLKELGNIRKVHSILNQDDSAIITKIRHIQKELEDYKTELNDIDKDKKNELISDLNTIINTMNDKLKEYDRGIEAEDARRIKDEAVNYKNILNLKSILDLINICTKIICYYNSKCDNNLTPDEVRYELSILVNNKDIINRSIPELKTDIENFKKDPDTFLL